MLQQTYLQPQQGFVKRSREECIQQVLMHKCKAKHSTTEAEPKMKKQYQTEENAAWKYNNSHRTRSFFIRWPSTFLTALSAQQGT